MKKDSSLSIFALPAVGAIFFMVGNNAATALPLFGIDLLATSVIPLVLILILRSAQPLKTVSRIFLRGMAIDHYH